MVLIKAPTRQDLREALGIPARPKQKIARQQVKKWQREAVKAIRGVFARMRGSLDAKSAATAGKIGHHELNQATTKQLALWARQEREMIAKIMSPQWAAEATAWLRRQAESNQFDAATPVPHLLRWRLGLTEIVKGIFPNAKAAASFREQLRQSIIAKARRVEPAAVAAAPAATAEEPRAAAGDGGKPPKSRCTDKHKRSTEKGEARAKLIAALTKHHKYADDSCLNTEWIGVRALARLAEVDPSTASAFFNAKFNRGEKKGWSVYRVVCRDAGRLVDSLKALNDEFSPHDLYGRRPRGEDDHDRDEEE